MASISPEDNMSSVSTLAKLPTSLDNLFHLYNGPLVRFLKNQLGNDASHADDIAQEAFCRIALYLSKDGELEHPRSLLFQIAKHLLIDFHRSGKVRQRSDHVTLEDSEPLSLFPSQEEIVANQQVLEKLEAVVLELPPRCQEVFILNRFEGMKHRDIAIQCGITVSMVEKHIKKALSIIRKKVRI